MSKLGENLEKVKSAAQNAAEKIKENEKVQGAAEKLNQNQIMQKMNSSKYAKFLKIGAVVLAVLLAFGLFNALFGNKAAKAAKKEIESQYTALYEEAGYKDISVKSKLIGKNTSADMYCFDTTINAKNEGEKVKFTTFILVHSDGEDVYCARNYDYEKANKKDVKEIALASLTRG